MLFKQPAVTHHVFETVCEVHAYIYILILLK